MIYRLIKGTVFQAFLEVSPWWWSCLNVGVPWGFLRTLVFHGQVTSITGTIATTVLQHAIILAQKSCNKIQPWTPSIGRSWIKAPQKEIERLDMGTSFVPPCGKWTNTWQNILGGCFYWKPSLRFSKCHCCLVIIGGFTTHYIGDYHNPLWEIPFLTNQ